MNLVKKKSLGQNFLTSKAVVSSILDASQPHTDDVILEIGPGEGFLTEELIKFSGKTIIVEKDHRLIPVLNEKFKNYIEKGKLDVLEKDILDFDISTLKFYKHPYKVIANIPYYITGFIIRKFLETEYKPISMTLLLQKEVAERIVAKDGKESLLSLSVKVFGNPKIVRKVGRGAFNPAPNVDSAVLHISNISNNKLENIDSKYFFEVLHAGFEHKRKQLLPNLANKFNRKDIENVFEKLNINPKIRAEDVGLEYWIKICKTLKQNEKPVL